MALRKVTRIHLSSFAKCAGVMGAGAGLMGAAGWIVWLLTQTQGAADAPGTVAFGIVMMLLATPAIAAMYGIVFAFVGGGLFNATARWHGGFAIDMTDA